MTFVKDKDIIEQSTLIQLETHRLDLYEYVVYGTVFHSGKENNNCFVYASFGGLLMKLFGSIKNNMIEEFSVDCKILLLIRKI